MPGEEFCSALVETGDGSLERVDISLRAWTGPPENTVGWWRSRVPERDRGKVYWAPPDVLLAFFQHSIESNNQPAAFLTALILLRKRILNWKDTVEKDGIRFMQLHCARNEQEYEVAECQLDPQQFDVIQNELNEKLFTDQDDVEGEMHGKEASE